ncbi:MAG: hypothetical protein V1913_16225 [Fibrobacterota bacterium]
MQTTIRISVVFLALSLAAACFAQIDMKEYKTQFDNGIKREQTAKEGIAVAQAAVSSLKEQLKEVAKQVAKNRADAFIAAGTTPEGLTQWKGQVAELISQADAFTGAASAEIVARQGEVPGFESRLTTLKQDRAIYMPGASELFNGAETSVGNARSAIGRAESENVSAAAAAKQAKIDAAKQAKLEAKQRAEEARQAKLEAKRQAAEAAAASAPAESGDPLAGLEDLQPGTTSYTVKYVANNRQTLSKMALKLWGDAKQWTRIYEVNKDKIEKAYNNYKTSHSDAKYTGPEDFIIPGETLTIPQ